MFDLSIFNKPLWPDTARRWRVYMAYPPISLFAAILCFLCALIGATFLTSMLFLLKTLSALTLGTVDFNFATWNHPWLSVVTGLVLGIFIQRVRHYFASSKLDEKVDRILEFNRTLSLRKEFVEGLSYLAIFMTVFVFIAIIELLLNLSIYILLIACIAGFVAFTYPTRKLIYSRILSRIASAPNATPDIAGQTDRSTKRFFYRIANPIFLVAGGLLCIVLFNALSTLKERQVDAQRDYGYIMSEGEAGKLEALLSEHPEDIDTRAQLLTYLKSQSHKFDEYRGLEMMAEHREHLLWFIEHEPTDPIVAGNLYSFAPNKHPDEYERAKAMWLGHLEKRPDNLKLLAAATDFFIVNKDDIALELAQRGRALDPKASEWGDRIGQIRARQLRAQKPTPEI